MVLIGYGPFGNGGCAKIFGVSFSFSWGLDGCLFLGSGILCGSFFLGSGILVGT